MMGRMIRSARLGIFLNVGMGIVFIIAAVIVVISVNYSMRQQALDEAQQKARLVLDRNFAIHTYFSQIMKPSIFSWSEPFRTKEYFDHTWMSSTYAIREIEKYFRSVSPSKYSYKDAAVNARSPENEADEYERAFLEKLGADTKQESESSVRKIDGEFYLVVMRKGEVMEASCLKCHSHPKDAPKGLTDYYGSERSFSRKAGDVVSVISLRIPISEAYAAANLYSLNLSAILLVVLGCLFTTQYWCYRRYLLKPLDVMKEKANQIATHEGHLGDQISQPFGRELTELVAAFNEMSVKLRHDRDHLEELVAERTEALRVKNWAIESATNAIVTFDLEGNLSYVNPAFLTLWRYSSSAEVLGKPAVGLWQMGETAAEVMEAVRTKEGWSGELVAQGKDGALFDVRVAASLVVNDAGQPVCMQASFADITEVKRAADVLRTSEGLLREAQHVAHIGHWELDRVAGTPRWSEEIFHIFGLDPLQGEPSFEDHQRIIHPDDWHVLHGAVTRALAEGLAFDIEFRLLRPDKSIRWMNAKGQATQDADGHILGILGTAQDVTERKQIEEALEQNRAELKAIYQQAPVMMCVVDADRRVLYANRLFTEFTGIPESDLLAGHACGVFGCVNALTDPRGFGFGQSCEDCSLRLAIEDTFKTGCGRRDIERRLTLERSGIRRDVVLLGATALIRTADRSTLLLCLQDITARKRVEEALVRRTRQLDAIRAVSFEISRELDLPTLLELINRRAAELVGATSGTVRLWDEQAGLLIPVAWHGLGEWMKDQSRRLGEGVAGTVAQRREGMIVNDYRASPYVHPAALERPEITAVLGEPLVYRDHLLGVLTVGKYGHGSSFTEGDQELLRLFAIQAAIAIENARLFEEVRAGRERLQALSRRQLEVHESERRLLARELHDEIGQLLTGLKLTLDMVAGEASDTGQSLLRESQDLVGELIGQVRELSLNLRPAVLDDLGLLPALLWQFERYTTRTQIQVDFQHAGLERRPCPSEVETAAYRIVQEALTNVARHAEASEVQVRLWVEGGKLLVRIEDQGRGFEPTITLHPEGSSGLAGMYERAMLLGGRLRIESSPGAGTRIQAELPLGEPERGS